MKDQVHPAKMKEGQPQLTMTSITSLEDLGPFFASICDNVTRQQTKSRTKQMTLGAFRQTSISQSQGSSSKSRENASDVINAIIERDFLEQLHTNSK